MISKELLTLHGSELNDHLKHLCAVEFANDIGELIDFLKIKMPGKIPSEKVIQNEIKNIFSEKYDIVSLNDNKYPKLLKQTNIAPVMLSIKGNIDFLQNSSIAVVGSRKLDSEDFAVIREIVNVVNDLDIGIISGLAYGTDIVAQIQSLKTGTISVLPCGFKYCYPSEHKKIVDKIIDFGGTVISEFFFSEPPRKMNFVKRNAVLVGIAESIIVARARSIKCGSMISANYAYKLGKTIYTLMFNGESVGNKFLLEERQAVRITSFEKMKYSILCDIAKNENMLDNSFKDKVVENIDTSLFESEDIYTKGNIESKIENILNYLNVKISISKIPYIFDICCKRINPSSDDRKKILIILLEKVL